MRKVIRYKLVRDCVEANFEAFVNSTLDKGFELYGNPYISNEHGSIIHNQALIKYKDEEC